MLQNRQGGQGDHENRTCIFLCQPAFSLVPLRSQSLFCCFLLEGRGTNDEWADSDIPVSLEAGGAFVLLFRLETLPACSNGGLSVLSPLALRAVHWPEFFRVLSVLCVCFLPIHSGHQVRWMYQPGSHRISHPPSFCGACLNFSREKNSAIPFPRRP